MTFTDEDLKRMKERLKLGDHFHGRFEEIYVLLIRLEAAEAYIEASVGDPDVTKESWKTWQAWRTAAGKDRA